VEVSALPHTGVMPGLRGPSPLLRLQSDERLIALTRRGQHAAFETLCSRYQSRLLSFCRHMLASREDAEDVLQEVFAAAFNAILADDRPINVRPWLYRIARNRSLNHLRRATAVGVDSMDVHFADHGISTTDKVLRRESFRELIEDVHDLPETQRTALLLREIDALSYDQIAEAMETTIPSVKSLLVRARVSLAEAAEARRMSCGEVRLELGEVAEGLTKLSSAARRHVRGCERCASFKRHLRENNHALAVLMPVAPLLIVKKVLLAKLGTTASAGHVAGGAGATAGATAGAASAAGAAAGGGAGFAGGLVTAGAGALATKAAATLAVATLVTAGAVAADHAVTPTHHHALHHALASTDVQPAVREPVVVHQLAQPLTTAVPVVPRSSSASSQAALRRRAAARLAAERAAKSAVPPVATAPAATTPVATPVAPPAAEATHPPSTTQVTEVTSQTTQLPPQATTTPTATSTTPAPAPPPPPTTTTTTTTTTTATTPAPLPTAEPVPVAVATPATPEQSGTATSPPPSGGTAAPAG
jgi:RNA polymerase sigma factor (sigma-70 family)